jgi:hypothetical protein
MMVHPDLSRLRAFASDELTASSRANAAAHLSQCQTCRDDVQWIDSMRIALRNAPAFGPSPGLWNTIERRVAANDIVLLPLDDHPVRAVNPAWRAAIAAMLVVCVAAGAAAVVNRDAIREWFITRTSDPLPAVVDRPLI